MRHELNYEAEPFAGYDEFLKSFLDQEDFPRTKASATVTWHGPWPLIGPDPDNAHYQLKQLRTLSLSGVYIVALHTPKKVGSYTPIRVGESKYLPRRLNDYRSSSEKTNPFMKAGLTLPKEPLWFFFGRVVEGDREMVQNAIARIFLRAGVPLTHHHIPRAPANVFPDAPVTIENVLPLQLRDYLVAAYGASGRDVRGQIIQGPYPASSATWAPKITLHLTPTSTPQPQWEVGPVAGDRDSGRWIRMGNRLIVLGA